jgi:hypothetical protein
MAQALSRVAQRGGGADAGHQAAGELVGLELAVFAHGSNRAAVSKSLYLNKRATGADVSCPRGDGSAG